MFVVHHHGTSQAKLNQDYEHAVVLDVTSRGQEPWVRFSPFYPHGDIPVPFSSGYTSQSVEGIWQGLKVFEFGDVDTKKFHIKTMKGIKRSARTLGKVLGHREGVEGEQLLSYKEARYALYLPSYLWTLEHRLQDLLGELRSLERTHTVVLLDYETNGDVNNLTKPLSHAELIKLYLEGNWPSQQ